MPDFNTKMLGREVDVFWRSESLIVEVDGYEYHSNRQAFESDRARDAALVAGGYRVIRVTWRQLVDRPYEVVARIAQALQAIPRSRAAG
jgi:very-short-patch-repair endonuclease